MATDTTEKQLITKLQEQLGFLAVLASNPSDGRFASKFSDVANCWEKLRDQVSKSKSRDIGDFFEAIGSGVIEAQRKLDERSEAYVRSQISVDDSDAETIEPSQSRLPATASLYRIPRVTAELKCSLETTKEKSLNLVFYSDRNDVREMHQQTIQIEVVAVPVPPDYLHQMKRADQEEEAEIETAEPTQPSESSQTGAQGQADRPIPFFLPSSEDSRPAVPRLPDEPLSFAEPEEPAAKVARPDARSDVLASTQVKTESNRQAVHQVISDLLRGMETNPQETESFESAQRFLLPHWQRTLCFSDGNNGHFLLLATEEKRPRLLLWQLVLRPASLRLLYKLPKQKDSQRQLARLWRFVSGLCDTQVAPQET